MIWKMKAKTNNQQVTWEDVKHNSYNYWHTLEYARQNGLTMKDIHNKVMREFPEDTETTEQENEDEDD